MTTRTISVPVFDQGDHRLLVAQKREEILQIGSRYGVYNIRLCGSVSRGTDTSHSDIDFLVSMKEGRTLLDLGSFQMDLKALLGCDVDVMTDGGLKKRLKERVLKDAVLL
ncbi:MAG: nucleotidyltransferase family protein [Methanospirillum sp.]|uniref:nucleotidyltransferase family protein n=1 Tax=Methanospirillum sp. TaxID=45200 RepID=UPI002371C868|nr:nucleotidyltransferase family protein [Methanospirillum sp.]MDD1728919.1 nucleotidyltransferase family protein [Methanospirillum sp.]